MHSTLIIALDLLSIAELEALRDVVQQRIDAQTVADDVPSTNAARTGGSLAQEYTRCGKPNCRCTRGQLHGPYWFRYVYKEGGGHRRIYIGKQKPTA